MATNMRKDKWVGPIFGKDLLVNYGSKLPPEGGLYLWKKCLIQNPDAIMDETKFKVWLSDCLEIPFIKAHNLKLSKGGKPSQQSIRPNFITFDGLEIGSGKYAKSRIEDFVSEFNSINLRQNVYNMFQDAVIQFSPILYIGEAGSIKNRIRDHLQGQSDFKKRLENIGIDYKETVLFYIVKKDKKKRERELLEYYLTHLLIAPMSVRAG